MEYMTFKNIDSTGLAYALYTPMGIGGWALNDPDCYGNYRMLGEEFGLTPENMVRTNQVHSAGVRVVTRENAGEGVIRPVTAEGYDGLITDVPGLMLCTVEADCTPVYLLDPVKKVVGMIHSGWKGTAGKISGNAVKLMKETYGTEPKDIIAAIGPCICRDCYEVSDDLIGPFSENFSEEDLKRFFTPKPNGRFWLDLKAAVASTLISEGVQAGNIEDSGYCTFHDNKFYSWRRDADRSVRMLTAICLR